MKLVYESMYAAQKYNFDKNCNGLSDKTWYQNNLLCVTLDIKTPKTLLANL